MLCKKIIIEFMFDFFFSSRRRHTRYIGDWSSDVCSSDLVAFTYIEDEVRSLQTFGSFLQRYRPLLQAGQGRFKLIFASDSEIGRASCRERVSISVVGAS